MREPARVRFGPFQLDRASYRLLRGDEVVTLPPKAIDLLFLFASRPHTLVTKDDMLAALWPGIAVTDNALTQVVSDLRQALGDDPASPEYVETVPRRGYRFVAAVEHVAQVAHARPVETGRTVLVSPFANVANDSSLSWLSIGIAETVANDLRAVRDLRVIDREPIEATPASAPAADIVVSGSFQRAGDRLRITAQAVDGRSRATLARARADGALADVFALQDAIVGGLSSGLKLNVTPAAAARMSARETSSLDAYRAVTEGRLKLETLELADVPGAIADFERAVALDPRYALAYVGLAHAHFWKFQASRASASPSVGDLHAAIAHARRAVDLDAESAEAHAALAMFLAAAERRTDAVAAGRIAVALEPGNWRHQFRLGIAAWGQERLTALSSVVAQFPALPYAHVGIAMVHVARGRLAEAEAAVRVGLSHSGPALDRGRFPGRGLHWLLGMLRLAAGDIAGAAAAFEQEAAQPAGAMHADEYVVSACDGLGWTALASGDVHAAEAHFRAALARNAGHAYAAIGVADVLTRRRDARAAAVVEQAASVIDVLARGGREAEAAMAQAYLTIVQGRGREALETLTAFVSAAPSGLTGWTVALEPWLTPLKGSKQYAALLEAVAGRAG